MSAKLDSCVEKVMAKGHDKSSAYGICRAALGEGEYPKGTTEEAKAVAKKAVTSKAKVKEARNVGHWLEARIHSAFTGVADDLFGEGYLTRDERIALSAAIGKGLEAFASGVQEAAPGLYERDPFEQPDEPMLSEASNLGAVLIPLVEATVRRDGTVPIKIIQPGWGASGYYSAEVLERDGPKVFTSGTHMYVDHPTLSERLERPERSVRDLAGTLTTDARWDGDGPDGPGLYAEAEVSRPEMRELLPEIAKDIGLSIQATGAGRQGTAEGRNGLIIERLLSADSVDYITRPGAGGKVLSLLESARANRPQGAASKAEEGDKMPDEKDTKTLTEVQERMKALETKLGERDTEIARLREGALLTEAAAVVREEVGRADLPDVTRARLMAQITANPPTKDGALDREALTQRVSEAIAAEREYLAKVTGQTGTVRGMGHSAQALEPAKAEERLTEAFRAFGFDEQGAKIAAKGR